MSVRRDTSADEFSATMEQLATAQRTAGAVTLDGDQVRSVRDALAGAGEFVGRFSNSKEWRLRSDARELAHRIAVARKALEPKAAATKPPRASGAARG